MFISNSKQRFEIWNKKIVENWMRIQVITNYIPISTITKIITETMNFIDKDKIITKSLHCAQIIKIIQKLHMGVNLS